jgi:hypothetical protein
LPVKSFPHLQQTLATGAGESTTEVSELVCGSNSSTFFALDEELKQMQTFPWLGSPPMMPPQSGQVRSMLLMRQIEVAADIVD